MRITVFCASSAKVAAKYFQHTEEAATHLVNNGYTIVYGGGSVGLMGCLADKALALNGDVIGILPHFMDQVEWGHKKLTRLVIVNDMHERKKKLIEDVDAVVALAGGTGTLEELAEVITLKRLGKFTKPIIILNTDGYYNPLIEMFEKMVDEKFLRPEHRQIWQVVDSPDQIVPAIKSAPPWDASAINMAAV